MTTPTNEVKTAAREAFQNADALTRELTARYPDLWRVMDGLRRDPRGAKWPEWCLLPMAAAVAGVTGGAAPSPFAGRDIAAAAALYAWRFTRSVYVIEPALADRLLNQVPDALDAQALYGLPEWCIY